MSKQRKAATTVWHIYRFKERYELPDDKKILRKSGLFFTRNFVGTGAGDEAVGFQNQFAMLCNGDGIDTALLHGLYGLLVKMAASHSYYRRGYLIGPDGCALSAAEIGQMLNIPGRRMLSLLRRFERVRLLELIEIPDFDRLGNEQQAGAKKGAKKKAGQGRRKTSKAGRKKATSENSGNFRNSLKGKANGNGLTAVTNANEQRAPNGANGSSSQQKQTAKEEPGASQDAKGLEGEPLEPQEAATSGAPGKVIPIHSSGLAHSAARAEPGAATAYAGGEYSRQDFMFGQRVYQALGLTWDPESTEGIRELTSFASKWRQAQRRLSGSFSPTAIDQIAMRLLQEARKIRRRPQNRNKGAVFNRVVDVIVDARLRERTG